MASRLVGTSSATRTLDERDLAALRPATSPKPRTSRKQPNPALRQVTSGIVCFCGERFGESEALEFMLHLRAEVGEVLDWKKRRRAQQTKFQNEWRHRPENHERYRAQQNAARSSPEFKARAAEAARARYRRKKAEADG